LVAISGDSVTLAPGADAVLEWTLPDTGGQPIAAIGLSLLSGIRTNGALYLDYLTWSGVPNVRLARAADGGSAWMKAWVNGLSVFEASHSKSASFVVGQNEGTGLAIAGAREWRNYTVSSTISVHLADAAGVAARVQGMRRYYAFVLCAGSKARLIKVRDGSPALLAECDLAWEPDRCYELKLAVCGSKLIAFLDGKPLLECEDNRKPLCEGAIGLICTEGRFTANWVSVSEK
jgi:hypothetical protein